MNDFVRTVSFYIRCDKYRYLYYDASMNWYFPSVSSNLFYELIHKK